MKNLNKFNNNDKGVSPVIGVILMVAATIVIAGVIMAMLGGFAPVEPTRSVSVSVTHDTPTSFAVVFYGGPAGGIVNTLSITVDGQPATPYTFMGDVGAPTSVIPIGNRTVVLNSAVGDQISAGPGNDHIIVTARFTDGITQVVLDTRV